MDSDSKQIQDKELFASEINNFIKAIDIQRERIFDDAKQTRKMPDGVRPNHDADYYMVLLRRGYRKIEEIAKVDSRVANLKGKYLGLYKKIKIRDHFEHGVNFDNFPEYSLGIKIACGVVINEKQSHIVSGDQQWFLNDDHEAMRKLSDELIGLFPFQQIMLPRTEEYTDAFQQLILDILQRRSLFRAFENSIIGVDKSITKNCFVTFYSIDYTRSQLTDLRKFFETDGRSYKISSIFSAMSDKTVQRKHKDIFENEWKSEKNWGVSLDDLANKTVMHTERGYSLPDVFKDQLDELIDKLNTLLDELIVCLKKEGISVSCFVRSPDSDFLKNQQAEDFCEYLKLAKSNFV